MSDNTYDRTGATYDTTRRADPFIVQRLHELLDPTRGGIYLDLGCGTGNYTVAMAGRCGRWVGVDISELMVQTARSKSETVEWCVADAASLPFQAGRFSGALCVLATHHFQDRLAVCRELRRVLQDGGRVVIFTADREQMREYWLNHYFPNTMARAIQQMASVEDLVEELTASGITLSRREMFWVRDDLQDLFLYCGKHRPQLYLEPAIRAGISTFSSLADLSEIEEGCRRLAADIATGDLYEVIKRYDSQDGDYLFLVGDAI